MRDAWIKATIIVASFFCTGCAVGTPIGASLERFDANMQHLFNPHPKAVTYRP